MMKAWSRYLGLVSRARYLCRYSCYFSIMFFELKLWARTWFSYSLYGRFEEGNSWYVTAVEL